MGGAPLRLPRPYIPYGVRIEVAERQFFVMYGRQPYTEPLLVRGGGAGPYLKSILGFMFGSTPVELHHRPALYNRTQFVNDVRGSKGYGEIIYVPPANDPEFLCYVTKADHDIETRVRGLHGQHSDLGLARKRKRKEKKAKAPKRKWPKRTVTRFARIDKWVESERRKYKWPKRKFPKRKKP